MAIYFKFKNERGHHSIPLQGSSMQVLTLKQAIVAQKKLSRGMDFDLVLTNASTKEGAILLPTPLPPPPRFAGPLPRPLLPAHFIFIQKRIPRRTCTQRREERGEKARSAAAAAAHPPWGTCAENSAELVPHRVDRSAKKRETQKDGGETGRERPSFFFVNSEKLWRSCTLLLSALR